MKRQRKGNSASLFSQSSMHVVNAVCLLLLLGFQVPVTAQTRQAPLAEINSYVAEVDRFTNRNTKARRIFADVAADDKPHWRELKTQREFEKFEDFPSDSAYVWSKGGKVIAAGLTFTSQSGDWAHMITYYFREDGSLAKIEAQLNTFYGDVSVIRQRYFDNKGTLLRSTQSFRNLETQKPIKKPAEYFDHPVPVYRKVSELPFYKLL